MSVTLQLSDEARQLLMILMEAELDNPEAFAKAREHLQADIEKLPNTAAGKAIKQEMLERRMLDIFEAATNEKPSTAVIKAASELINRIDPNPDGGVVDMRRRSHSRVLAMLIGNVI